MRPAFVGDTVVVEATTLSRGKTLAVCTVDISNKETGKLIAQGRHSKCIAGQKSKSN